MWGVTVGVVPVRWLSHYGKATAHQAPSLADYPSRCTTPFFGLFMLVYRIVKRMAPFENLSGDAEVATMVGGTIAAVYQTRGQVVPIMHAIGALIQAAEGHVLKDAIFFALASDSSTHRGAHKAQLVYTRTMRNGQSCTVFLGL